MCVNRVILNLFCARPKGHLNRFLLTQPRNEVTGSEDLNILMAPNKCCQVVLETRKEGSREGRREKQVTRPSEKVVRALGVGGEPYKEGLCLELI